jgi:hypothetical protein
VALTVALPPTVQLTVQLPFGKPLQAAREKAASKRIGRMGRALLRFMWHPTIE